VSFSYHERQAQGKTIHLGNSLASSFMALLLNYTEVTPELESVYTGTETMHGHMTYVIHVMLFTLVHLTRWMQLCTCTRCRKMDAAALLACDGSQDC
jgi:hypothetical protein